jgi:substrate import-associated zinc metallohydrolase lipoprotein
MQDITNMKLKYTTLFLIGTLLLVSCYSDESVESPVKTVTESDDPLDQYIQTNYQDEYGVAVRYKYVDRYYDASKRASPPERDVVIPMLEFLNSFWIEPYINVPNGKRFFESHIPAEIVLIGSSIYNDDGTVLLGTADAGARITLTEVNFVDIQNREWVFRQLGTIYHEFAHIVHQRYNLPPNFQQISPEGYTSAGSWFTLSDEDALQRGFVSPYGTSSFNEDFAEIVAFLLYDPDFYDKYINDEPNCSTADCEARNEGRARLRRKYNAILEHYQENTGVDLLSVRALIQAKLQ